MPDTLSGMSELELLTLDPETGEAPPARLADVRAALAIYTRLRDADAASAVDRSRLDAMFDGVAPYDTAVLRSTGQGSRTNLNFGEAQRLLDVDLSAFTDLYSSLDTLVRVKTGTGPATPERMAQADVIAEEITRTFREWPEFHSTYLRLCTEFIKHGTGVAYFVDDRSWKCRVTGLGDFLVPRQTSACEDGVEVAASRRSYMLHELYDFIRDPKIAANRGWNVAEARRVMVANATNSASRSGQPGGNWEALQRELKNNDLVQGVENTSVNVVHMWVRELRGAVSQYVFAEDNPEAFLFEKRNLFANAQQAFVFFTFGVGNNGTLHSVRGKGQRIFAHIQTSNRLRSQMVDAAFLGGSVMLQPQSERALEKLSYTIYGPYSILSPDVDVVEKGIPNLSQTMQPALDSVEAQLSRNSDPTSTYGDRSSPYRNELQTEHDLAVASRLTGATLNLFYSSWTRLLREMVRRLVSAPGDDALVRGLHARCGARGVPRSALRAIDHAATVAVQAIGSGSAANRLLALRELNTIAGGYDETGRYNLRRDITTARVGRDLAERYVGPSPAPRTSVEGKVALLENNTLLTGQQIPVLSEEMHGEHMTRHAPVIQEVVAGIESGETDPVAALPGVEALHAHATEHVQWLSQDPMAEADAAGYRQLLQQTGEIITNTRRKIEAMQRKAQEEEQAMAQMGGDPAAMGQEPAEPSPTQLRMEEHQLKLQMAQESAELDRRIKEAKAQQELSIIDAKRALTLDR